MDAYVRFVVIVATSITAAIQFSSGNLAAGCALLGAAIFIMISK